MYPRHQFSVLSQINWISLPTANPPEQNNTTTELPPSPTQQSNQLLLNMHQGNPAWDDFEQFEKKQRIFLGNLQKCGHHQHQVQWHASHCDRTCKNGHQHLSCPRNQYCMEPFDTTHHKNPDPSSHTPPPPGHIVKYGKIWWLLSTGRDNDHGLQPVVQPSPPQQKRLPTWSLVLYQNCWYNMANRFW